MRVLFAHGFEGAPNGGKPTYMIEQLGWDVVTPVMSSKGWNIEQETNVLLDYIDDPGIEPFDLIAGSSMGGLAAANASALRPDADFGVLLIAPAFGLEEMWRNRLTAEEMRVWEISGGRVYEGFELNIRLNWDFMTTAKLMSWPKLNHPTVILHGIADDVVPIENSQRVATDQSNVIQLMEIEDGHRMQKSTEYFEEAARYCLDSLRI
tara:strand:+ start:2268 stop:2891 length:624 start_codon:yes stop_codon:yes gene_type:complete